MRFPSGEGVEGLQTLGNYFEKYLINYKITITFKFVQQNYNYMAFEQSN